MLLGLNLDVQYHARHARKLAASSQAIRTPIPEGACGKESTNSYPCGANVKRNKKKHEPQRWQDDSATKISFISISLFSVG
jgi:hypothetical protein